MVRETRESRWAKELDTEGKVERKSRNDNDDDEILLSFCRRADEFIGVFSHVWNRRRLSTTGRKATRVTATGGKDHRGSIV